MKKFKDLKEIRVNMGLFDFDVLAYIGDYLNMEKVIRFKFEDEKFDLIKSDAGYEPRGKTFFRRGYVPIIWIPRKPQTPREYATLAHEALHAVFHLFEWVGLPIGSSTEEVMTHSMAHIVNKVLEG